MPNKTAQKAPPSKERKDLWIPKPRKSPILLCECGNKYIKTRKEQKICLDCIYRARLVRA